MKNVGISRMLLENGKQHGDFQNLLPTFAKFIWNFRNRKNYSFSIHFYSSLLNNFISATAIVWNCYRVPPLPSLKLWRSVRGCIDAGRRGQKSSFESACRDLQQTHTSVERRLNSDAASFFNTSRKISKGPETAFPACLCCFKWLMNSNDITSGQNERVSIFDGFE